MKCTKLLVIAVFAVAAFCITACGHEGKDGNVILNAVKDVDGNVYDAVKLGNQVWMTSNLRTTHYADGTSIPLGDTWSFETPYRYVPGSGQTDEENMANVPSCGYLYNWKAVMGNSSSSSANPSGVQGICPDGWHVPSDAEWTQLENYVSSKKQYVCGGESEYIAKALASTTGWIASDEAYAVGNDQSSNNATGFSALPAGSHGVYSISFGGSAYFWSSTEDNDNAWTRQLFYGYAGVYRYDGPKTIGFSVRCVRD